MSNRPSNARIDRPDWHGPNKQWLDQWQRVGEELEVERTAELQALTDEDAARIAVQLVWPIGTLGGHRGGDDGAGLELIQSLQRRRSVRR